MKKRNLVIAATTATVIGSGLAYAGSKHHGGKHNLSPEHRVEHMIMKMDKRLDLTDAQETEIQSILESRMGNIMSTREARREIRQNVMQLDPKSADFDAQVEALAGEMSELVRQKTMEIGEAMKEVSAVLTDEQVEKARKMIAKRIEARNKRKEHNAEWHNQG